MFKLFVVFTFSSILNAQMTQWKLRHCVENAISSSSNGQMVSASVTDLSVEGQEIHAGYNESQTVYAASQAKVAALFAAHQLRYDLEQKTKQYFAQANGSITAWSAFSKALKDFPIGWSKSFYTVNTQRQVLFTDKARTIMDQAIRVSNNASATTLISTVTLQYLQEALLKVGLYDQSSGGGLWLGRGYGGSSVSGALDPLYQMIHTTSALAADKFYVSLHKKELVSEEDSESMLGLLHNSAFRNKFILGLTQKGLKVNQHSAYWGSNSPVILYRKTGTWSKYSHDSALVYREACSSQGICIELKYAVSFMSWSCANAHSHPEFIKSLDSCIERAHLQ